MFGKFNTIHNITCQHIIGMICKQSEYESFWKVIQKKWTHTHSNFPMNWIEMKLYADSSSFVQCECVCVCVCAYLNLNFHLLLLLFYCTVFFLLLYFLQHHWISTRVSSHIQCILYNVNRKQLLFINYKFMKRSANWLTERQQQRENRNFQINWQHCICV